VALLNVFNKLNKNISSTLVVNFEIVSDMIFIISLSVLYDALPIIIMRNMMVCIYFPSTLKWKNFLLKTIFLTFSPNHLP
jgi:hypothetical protein